VAASLRHARFSENGAVQHSPDRASQSTKHFQLTFDGTHYPLPRHSKPSSDPANPVDNTRIQRMHERALSSAPMRLTSDRFCGNPSRNFI